MKRRKYGFIYKTHLFGRPTVGVMWSGQRAAHFARRAPAGVGPLARVSAHYPGFWVPLT